MARKRKRIGKAGRAALTVGNGPLWPETIVDELLAYLDSGIAFLDPGTDRELERSYTQVDEMITQHLSNLSEGADSLAPERRQYSALQVRDKLRRLWMTHGRQDDGARDWKVIYRHGSTCLMESKDQEQMNRIARRAAAIKHNWKTQYLKSPRKTRASSQVSRDSQSPLVRSGTLISCSPTLQDRVRSQRMARKHPLRQRYTANDSENESDSTSSTSSVRDVASHIKVENPGIEIIIPRKITSNSDRALSREKSNGSMSPECEIYGTPSTGIGSFTEPHIPTGTCISADTLSSSLSERVQSLEKELQALKEESALEIDFWKAAYQVADDKLTESSKETTRLVVKLGSLWETKSPLTINDFLESQAMASALAEQIDSQKQVQSLRRRAGVDGERHSAVNITDLMQEIDFLLQQILKEGRFTHFHELPDLDPAHSLRALVAQTFGSEWGSGDVNRVLEQIHEHRNVQQCSLRALSGAALAQWVFQKTQADLVFDRYQGDSSRSSLSRYRLALNIVALEDPNFARAIDLKVHQRVTEEASFEHFRKRKAQALALKLQEALEPLWTWYPVEDDGFDPGFDNDYSVTEQLSIVFEKALEVQCQLVLSGYRHECVWHSPGTPYDETSMAVDKGEGDLGTVNPTVRLTLLPGICQLRDTRIGADFGGFADGRRWPQDRASRLVQPVVWRGCPEPH